MSHSQDISDPETQFLEQSDDEEKLWDAIKIVAERSKEFKVKWDGIDNKTGKPWPDSWVYKHDVTPDLVNEWRLKHPRKSSTASSVYPSVFS